MADIVVDGVVFPDDENLIIVPVGYPDSIITKEHMTQKGESIVTCNMLVEDLMNKIGQVVSCPDCGKNFKVIRQEDTVPKPEPVVSPIATPKVEDVAPKVEEITPKVSKRKSKKKVQK